VSDPPRVPLGVGIYSLHDVARLLQLHPGRVSRWLRGYRYSWETKERERRRGGKPAVIKTDLPVIEDTIAVSFLELMELLTVRRFVEEEGIPLQTVRVAWGHAAKAFKTPHPFANRRVFTDRGQIFMALEDGPATPDVLEISSRKRPFQVIAGPIFEQSLKEIDFDEETELARRWWPRGKHTPIVLDPRVVFGAPAIEGTRIPTDVVAGIALASSPDEAASAYGLSAQIVQAAVEFEVSLARAA
jgi:uncharacterized protein (DUF433 family)